MSQFQTMNIHNIRLHVCPTKKFKTTTLLTFIQQDLTKEFVTKNALLPAVLQRGTRSYPGTLELKRKLDDLYGASLYGDVMKRGERHVLHFGMELANEQYLQEKDNHLLREGLTLLSEMLFKPVVEGNGFKKSYVQAEKKNLKQRIESLQDDKGRYASQKMVEAMCSEESYSLFHHGLIEDISSITAENLYTYYLDVIGSCPIDIYCVGNVDVDEVCAVLKEVTSTISSLKKDRRWISVQSVAHPVNEVKVVVDELDIKQGKLNIGCRTNIFLQDEAYPALLVYNGILGGFPHSKLFVNVREKESLAYYANSKLESHKGLLLIQSGIEIKNYEKAVRIIKQQLSALAQGKISSEELNQTKAMIGNQLREQQDRAAEMIHFHYQSVLANLESWSVDKVLTQMDQVDKADIQKVAEKIQLDTIYFLRDKENAQDGKN